MWDFWRKNREWLRCLSRLLLVSFESFSTVVRAYRSREPLDDSPFLRLGWKLKAEPPTLPDWFEQNRVQGSTRLAIKRYFGRPEFTSAAAGFRALGARVFMRHAKGHDEDPWWPTAEPVGTDGGSAWDGNLLHRDPHNPGACTSYFRIPDGAADVVQDMVDEARREGLPMIAYYRHMAECRIAVLHPERVCKELEDHSTPVPDRFPGFHVDLTTPYRDIVLQRLIELAEKGVSGFNFDYRHMPPHGGWTETLETAFEKATGSSAPRTKNEQKSVYRKYLDFQAYQVEETFAYWKRAVKRRFPNVVFVVSTTTIPSLTNRRMTTNLARIADSAKNEYTLALSRGLHFPLEEPPPRRRDPRSFFEINGLAEPEDDVRMAFGWTLLRDSSDGRPPRIWAPNFPNRQHAYAFAASLITYGAIANMNVREEVLHDVITGENTAPVWATPRDALEAAFDLGNQTSPHLSRTRPARWAAVHYSELARNRRGGDLSRAWQEVLWPTIGAFGVFVREGLPVGIVNDYQLDKDQLDGYKLLFLPNSLELTGGQKRSIARFASRGGILLANDAGWPWNDPARTQEAAAAFRTKVLYLVDCFPAPVQVKGGPKGKHAVVYEDGRRRRIVVAVTNDFAWVQTQTEDRQVTRPEPPPASIDDALVLVKNRARPRRVFEAITGAALTTETIPDGYQVRLPEFETMALLVIEE